MPDFSSQTWAGSPTQVQPNIYGAEVAASGPSYAERKRVAEALRAKVERLQSTPQQASSFTTAASGAYPGQTDVNWGGIAQNVMNSYQGAKAERDAGVADNEAANARREAFAKLTGEKMTPQQMMAFGEANDMPEVTAQALKQLMPQVTTRGEALRMVAQNPALAAMYVNDGTLTQDDVAAFMEQRGVLAQQESEAKLAEKEAELQLGQQYAAPRELSDYERYMQNPEAYARWKQAGFKPSGGSGGGSFTQGENGELIFDPGSSVSASTRNKDLGYAQEYQDLADRARVQGAGVQRILSGLAATTPSLRNKAAQFASASDFNSIAELLRTPEMRNVSAEVIGQAVENARLLAPVSNTDFEKLLAQYPSALTNPESATKFFSALDKQSRGAQEKYDTLTSYHTARSNGVIPYGMTATTFKRKLAEVPSSADEDEKEFWNELSVDEKYEIVRRTGGLR